MKKILGIAVVLGVVGALTVGCSKEKDDVVNLGNNVVIDLGNNVKLDMVLIPAGKFLMGSKKNAVDPFSNIKVEQPNENELPQHEVTLTKPYYMGKYEVTQEQWFEIMGENPSYNKGRKLPVTDVSWKDCQEFIKKLNTKTNGGYRLPTEAEWDYACRAGTTTAYSFGDEITPKNANYKNSKIAKPVEVGGYKPNAFGLYDMHGNVDEWCEDWLGGYDKENVTDPKEPQQRMDKISETQIVQHRIQTEHVVRGGSFLSDGWSARSSKRGGVNAYALKSDTSFRLAKTK
jgi:formylglycine-generating enzyme required for sulfatase activity